MLERKCSWKFKIQFLVPKKIKIKEQTLNSNSLNVGVVPATNIIKNPKKKRKKKGGNQNFVKEKWKTS